MIALALTNVMAAQAPMFEVATIKASSGDGAVGGGCHGTDSKFNGVLGTPPPLGMCVMQRVTLKMLIQEAYELRGPDADELVSGGPGWINTDRFDVQAKAATPAPIAEMRLMLESLLAERFQLVFHREKKELSGFVLRPAKDGPKVTEVAPSETGGFTRVNGGPLVARSASMAQLLPLAASCCRPLIRRFGAK